jgi:pimeloyl-ACP methyl ester carboxylesterase
VIPVLARKQRVIALDLRGFGWSGATPRGYLKEELASDALAGGRVIELSAATLMPQQTFSARGVPD